MIRSAYIRSRPRDREGFSLQIRITISMNRKSDRYVLRKTKPNAAPRIWSSIIRSDKSARVLAYIAVQTVCKGRLLHMNHPSTRMRHGPGVPFFSGRGVTSTHGISLKHQRRSRLTPLQKRGNLVGHRGHIVTSPRGLGVHEEERTP